MNKNILNLETTVPPLRNLISRSPRRGGLFLVPLTLTIFALAPASRAVSPAPDGGYPNGNTAEGDFALESLTTGTYNTSLGYGALFSDTSGGSNSATGAGALYSNTTGNQNTANGVAALFSNTTIGVNSGHDNTATGFAALNLNTTGRFNTASGSQALGSNTTGNSNSANGYQALFHNNSGFENTASGDGALFSNTLGDSNTAVGYQALLSNSTGFGNTANGHRALFSNTGDNNTAVGDQALFHNNRGGLNTAIGRNALQSNTTGIRNTAIGSNAGSSISSGSGNVAIGSNVGGANVSNTTWIKNIYETVQPVVGVVVDNVTVDFNGRLGRANVSSRRYKHEIKPMDRASEAILALKPVTFRYKQEIDPTQTLAFGLIAEEVAEVYPDLVGRNPDGQPESVRYEQINAMLLNEFLKAHHQVQDLKTTVAAQQKQIEALIAGLQKVSAQLEVNKTAPQMALNHQ